MTRPIIINVPLAFFAGIRNQRPEAILASRFPSMLVKKENKPCRAVISDYEDRERREREKERARYRIRAMSHESA